jgi:alpha-amylase
MALRPVDCRCGAFLKAKINWLMKSIVRLCSAIYMLGLLVACEDSKAKPEGVYYEIFVRSFADSNGDGIGDLNGITHKLDYLDSLGISGLWLTPVMPSPSYHKYDVVDYLNIDPEYGTLDDFKVLVQEAHRRNMKVILDLVLNHTSNLHPWFKQATVLKNGTYRHYYVWAKRDSVQNQIAKKKITFDSDNITQWHKNQSDTLSEYYYGFFWGGMPDLNMDHLAVRNEISAIGKFWLEEMGVDGFRLDAARHVYPSDQPESNHKFWKWFRKEMQQYKPDVYLVGEVWAQAPEVAPYLPGLPSLFNFDLAYAISNVVKQQQDTMHFIDSYLSIQKFYAAHSSEYVDAIFLRNHDQNRILTELDGDQNKLRTSVSILMTLPGTPYLYYGEEIGMYGKKPDEQIREPFIWTTSQKDKFRTKWIEPIYNTDSSVSPLTAQMKDQQSVFNFYRSWISYRNASKVLTSGALESTTFQQSGLISFYRVFEDRRNLVLHNISAADISILVNAGNVDFATNPSVQLSEGKLYLPKGASAVLGD